ncbi:hypothetical protein GWO62_09375 [Corynebacterium macginleyi]|uniref:hypothetical protein n=1 Tax=Corynebacterium macginleyi TaxID=38290 RepID=UPI00190C92BC|nr:hypothetical protein [Corynebacterium macginleyi]MBK4153336.1 hypothetical protein [Corynebacterium macginleyi]
MGWSAKPPVLSLAVPLGIKSKSHLITHHLSIAEELTTALADYMAGKAPQAELASGDEGNTPAKEALDLSDASFWYRCSGDSVLVRSG